MADDHLLRLTPKEAESLHALLKRAELSEDEARAERARKRRPGQFKGLIDIGPEFFEPLTDDEIDELTGG